MATFHETPVVGVLPHGKAGTRCPPRVEHLGIGTRTGVQPLEEIEGQVLEAVVHPDPVNFGTRQFFHTDRPRPKAIGAGHTVLFARPVTFVPRTMQERTPVAKFGNA